MKRQIIFFFLFSFVNQKIFSFTLLSPNPPRYTTGEVYVDFTNDSCSQTGFSPQYLFNLMEESINQFWNKVSSARLLLLKGDFVDVSSAGLDPSSLAAEARGNRILVGCNDAVAAFASGGVVAVGTMGQFDGETKGSIIINDHANSEFSTLSDDKIRALLAHELGHALGLGHSENVSALMYYSLGSKIQEKMSQDDYDALTYLYPHNPRLMGLGGSCGTISFDHSKEGEAKWYQSYFLLALLPLLMALLLRPLF